MTVVSSASATGAEAGLALDPAALDVEALAATFGTPLYVYDLDVVTRRVAHLRAALPERVTLAYAVKANPSLAVVAHLVGLGLGTDVASAAELATVIRAGVEPFAIVMTGPGKGASEHRAAVDAGALVTVESLGELERLERESADAGVVTRILIRASVAEEGRGETVRIIGDAGAGKFGMDEGDLRLAARTAVASRHLELLGLHRFGASNVTDAAVLVAAAARAVELARDVIGGTGGSVRVVDIGGGLGIPYADEDATLDVAALGRGLGRILDDAATVGATAGLRLLLEPGRFLVGPAGGYVARVVDRKRVAGSEVAILDGGIHHVLRPALVRQPHRLSVVAVGRPTDPGETTPLTVAGPLCTGLDVLGAAVPLPHVEPDDLLVVRDVGAYGFTESMPFFLSHPVPAEVAIRGGEVRVVRPRMSPAEWLDRQLLPEWG